MGEVLRFAVAHLVGDRRRSLAEAMAILVAVTSFVVLTGMVTTQRLQVRQEVASNYGFTSNVLVRPHGSTTGLEHSDGVVRPNFLAGQYGGITLDQLQQIAAVPGVDVAAPIAVLGQTMRNVLMTVNVGDVLGTRDSAMVRYSVVGTARNGTAATTNQRGYLYLTRKPLATVDTVHSKSQPTSPAQVERRAGRRVTPLHGLERGRPPSDSR